VLKRAAWLGMAVLAILVVSYAASAVAIPALRSPFVRDLFARSPIAGRAHLAGGGLALLLGAFQVNAGLRRRFLAGHRWLGRAYVTAVTIGGTAGLVLAIYSSGGLTAHLGFGLLALCWLFTTLLAFRYIRAGKQAIHREWMMRSYALTLAAVTLRIYLLASQALGLPFAEAYPAISWLAWVPNLLVVEWWMLARRGSGGTVPPESLAQVSRVSQ